MRSNERREKLIQLLEKSREPVMGKKLAEELGVSRQVIVQDITLLRAQNYDITATTNGYVLESAKCAERVFKVIHTEEDVEKEMSTIIDYGGTIEDVFIYHRVYGTVKAEMGIRSRRDIEEFIENLATGKSSLLMNVTSGYHYHTVSAPTEKILDLIQQQLDEQGFLAKLTDYEPVDFWSEEQ